MDRIQQWDYLKFGALVSSRAKQAMFTPIYESRKKIDVSLAILFIAPIRNTP